MNKYILLPILSLVAITSQINAQQIETKKNLRRSVEYFSSDSLQGRKAGTAGEVKAAEFLYDELSSAGVYMLTSRTGQDFSISLEGDTIYSRNIVGMIEGSDPQLRKEYIVIGANLDHLGTNILNINGNSVTQVYPGADCNASGLACLIELARDISITAPLFKRTIIIVGFGAKEMGMAGSWYFVNRAFKEINDVSLMINLDMVGRQGLTNFLAYYTCVPNTDINSIVSKLASQTSFVFPEQGTSTPFPSDYLTFYEKNIPVTLFTTGLHRDYHTIRDKASELDYDSMEGVCHYLYSFVMEAANRNSKISQVEYSNGKDDGQPVYSPYEVDKAPTFFKGNEATFLKKWVYTYLKYPEVPMKMGIQGEVIVEFIIEADGTLTNVRIARGIDDYLDDEVIRVVSVSPKWTPGMIGDRKVRVKYSLPVEFRLKKR